MTLQIRTASNNTYRSYKRSDGDFQKVEDFPKTGGSFSMQVSLNTLSGIYESYFIPKLVHLQAKPFEVERKYLQILIKDNAFYKKNEGKYIAIFSNEVLGIDSNYSNLASKAYSDSSIKGNIYITRILKNTEIAHFDSPF